MAPYGCLSSLQASLKHAQMAAALPPKPGKISSFISILKMRTKAAIPCRPAVPAPQRFVRNMEGLGPGSCTPMCTMCMNAQRLRTLTVTSESQTSRIPVCFAGLRTALPAQKAPSAQVSHSHCCWHCSLTRTLCMMSRRSPSVASGRVLVLRRSINGGVCV